MKRLIDLDQVRVVQADNSKGNPRVYLEIMDERVFYADVHDLRRSEDWSSYVTEDEFHQLVVDTESLADIFRIRLGYILADLLRARSPDLRDVWTTSTDREIDYTKPRLEETDD